MVAEDAGRIWSPQKRHRPALQHTPQTLTPVTDAPRALAHNVAIELVATFSDVRLERKSSFGGQV